MDQNQDQQDLKEIERLYLGYLDELEAIEAERNHILADFASALDQEKIVELQAEVQQSLASAAPLAAPTV